MPDSDASSHPSAGPPPERIRVLLPLPLAGAYDYRAPEGGAPPPGSFVVVPLGRRRVAGVVWDGERASAGGSAPAEKLREVEGVLDAPPMPEPLRRLVEWVAAYTLSPPGAVLRMAMSVPAALVPPRPATAFARAGAPGEARLTEGRRRVLALLEDGPPRLPGEIAREAGVGPSVVKAMAEAGLLRAMALPPPPPFARPDPTVTGPVLSDGQREAAEALCRRVEERRFSVTLLDGVPGSGKTEVYFEAMATAFAAGRQVLVLVPEIALTAQWLARFRQRFGVMPAAWHSELTPAQRRLTWRAVAEGTARVVVGARSSLFLPFPELGLIVVDEEHDVSFKQDEGVAYHARDMAVVRARLTGFPVVLVSATPSLESVVNAEQERYGRLHLPDRHAGAALPHVAVVDLRAAPPPRGGWLSPPLRAALDATLAAGEQAMLFLNRRGYAPLTLCRRCGHRMQCPNCTAWLVEHRLTRRLQCHHCGFAIPTPEHCPACDAEDSLAACGPGVERLAEEVGQLWPDARLGLMTSDTLTGPHVAEEMVRKVQDHELDLLIGTQVMAKGHHFPMLTLVGVVDADLGLSGGDLRASERTYQLLYQVAGRAGRAERPGRVLLQSWAPEHPVMAALVRGDRDRFLAAEADERRAHAMPPFGRLAALVVSGPDEAEVDGVARALGRTAPSGDGVEVLGPAPAPLSVLRGRHRRRLLLKARREVNVQQVLRPWLARVRPPASVRVQVDVDPYGFL